MTGKTVDIQKPQEASTAQIADQVLTGGITAPSGSGLNSAVIEDPAVQAAMQPWVEMECYQLSRGEQLSQMDCLDFGNQQIVRESQHAAIQKQGVMPSNLCTISYCTPDPKARFSELNTVNSDTVFFLPESTEFDIYIPQGLQTAYICFNQDEFLSGAQALNPARWENVPKQLLTIESTQQSLLKETVNRWLKMAETNVIQSSLIDQKLIRKMLLQDILQITATKTCGDWRPLRSERNRALHLCQEARAFIEGSLMSDIVPTIVDTCKVLGVSERTLQYAFRSYVDMSPLAYLRLCRLHRVRATLKASDPQNTTVTAIAMRYGFLHLGRFALEYRQLFNETPSATLAS